MSAEQSGRLLCIGDVHGCAAELEVLLDALALAAHDTLVFLGDYIDRGEASAGVIEQLIRIRRDFPRTVFLRGNHEEMLLDFLGLEGSRGSIFVRAGGASTLESYGVDPRGRGDLAEQLRTAMPDVHLDFLSQELVLSHVVAPWLFVHAGVRPQVALEAQVADDLLWIREGFLGDDHGLDETVVFGHTPQRDVQFSSARRVAMDTGCVYGGRLSALDLSGGLLHQVAQGSAEATTREVRQKLARTLGGRGGDAVTRARGALLAP